MLGSTFETGVRAAAGYGSQSIPSNTAEDLEVVTTLKLSGDNTYGQLGIGTVGGFVSESNAVVIEGVLDLSIGNGAIFIVDEE